MCVRLERGVLWTSHFAIMGFWRLRTVICVGHCEFDGVRWTELLRSQPGPQTIACCVLLWWSVRRNMNSLISIFLRCGVFGHVCCSFLKQSHCVCRCNETYCFCVVGFPRTKDDFAVVGNRDPLVFFMSWTICKQLIAGHLEGIWACAWISCYR